MGPDQDKQKKIKQKLAGIGRGEKYQETNRVPTDKRKTKITHRGRVGASERPADVASGVSDVCTNASGSAPHVVGQRPPHQGTRPRQALGKEQSPPFSSEK